MLRLRRQWLGLAAATVVVVSGAAACYIPPRTEPEQTQPAAPSGPLVIAEGSRLGEYWSAMPVNPEPTPIPASRARQAHERPHGPTSAWGA